MICEQQNKKEIIKYLESSFLIHKSFAIKEIEHVISNDLNPNKVIGFDRKSSKRTIKKGIQMYYNTIQQHT